MSEDPDTASTPLMRTASPDSSYRQLIHSQTEKAALGDIELQKQLTSRGLELNVEDQVDQALPELEEPNTAQALRTWKQGGGGANIIVLNVGNTKNLATALSQIVSSNFPKEEDTEEKCSLEATNKKHTYPERRQSAAAFMLVPLPQALPPSVVPTEHSPSIPATPAMESNSSNNSQSRKCMEVPSETLETSPIDAKKTCFCSTERSAFSSPCHFPKVRLESCLDERNLFMEHTTRTSWCGNPLSQMINDTTTISSSGLAFLAQVSSLASDQKVVKGPTTAAQNHGVSQDCGNNGSCSETNVDRSSSRSDIANISSGTASDTNSVKDVEELQTSIDAISSAASEVVPRTGFQMNCIAEKRKKEMPLPVMREKKKKGPAPKLSGDEVCLVCGDRASGFHYNTLSCEGCKGFFRRSVIKNGKYQCKQKGVCTMDLYMRRKCQKCRFDKCKAAGMREESVLSEENIRAKKMKKERDTRVASLDCLSDAYYPKLTPQQRSLLELLKANERRFQWPTSEDVKKVTVWVEGDDTPHGRALRFAHFTELCILIVQLVVEFTKQLPGFLSVPREDQIVLLKACAIEVLLLRAAKQYNKHDGTINFLNGKLYDKSSFYKAGMQVEFVDPIFKFCNSMSQLDLDETEYAILVAINTFSTDRPHIKDTEKVECMQEPYVELLRVYSRIKHPNDPLMFARILMKIVELRTLNNYHSEQIFALKVQDRKLPPLLAEIWDM